MREICGPGAAIRVQGNYSVNSRYGPHLAVRRLRAAEPQEVDLDRLCDGPPRSADADGGRPARDPRARSRTRTCGRCSTRSSARTRRRGSCSAPPRPPSATTRPTATACSSTASPSPSRCRRSPPTFPGIDREVAVTGALLHDIGKLDAYTSSGVAIDLTDLGKLQGEIPLGYYRIRRLIEDLPDFPEELAAAVLHIILSHHGALEHGSPVVPCTREATLVHMIDNLGGRLGSFDRLEKELPQGSRWSAFDRALGGGAFFADRRAA